MKMKNMFHLSTKLDWSIGDKITAGEIENPFWSMCKNFSPALDVYGQRMSPFEMFERYPTFPPSNESINFLYTHLKGISSECALYIREQIFEQIRKEKFDSLPSRHKCLWLTDNENLNYWKTKLEKNHIILTLDLDGDIFCGNDYWLTANTLSSVDYEQRALHYWNGELNSQFGNEYLFYGQAIITDIKSLN